MSDTTLNITRFNGLVCQIPNFRENILRKIQQDTNDKLFINFANQFLAYLPVDYVEAYDIEDFEEITKEAYEYFKGKLLPYPAVEIKSNQWKNAASISISLVCPNWTFLFSALNNLFLRLNIQTSLIINSVIQHKRSDDGSLESISVENSKYLTSSVIFIKIMGDFSPNNIRILKNEINNLYSQLEAIYNLWPKAHELIESITSEMEDKRQFYLTKKIDIDENINFLKWLKADNFTFLGALKFDCDTLHIQTLDTSINTENISENKLNEIIKTSASSEENDLICFGKLNIISPIHFNRLINYVLVKNFDEGKYSSGIIIFGVYSSTISFNSLRSVPLIRQKLNLISEEPALALAGYSQKHIANLFDRLPRDILFEANKEELRCIYLHLLSALISKKLKVFLQQNPIGEYINILIFISRDRLTFEVHQAINHYLADIFSSVILAEDVSEISHDIVQLSITVKIDDIKKFDFSASHIEAAIDQISMRWIEVFKELIIKDFDKGKSLHQLADYGNMFPASYRHVYEPNLAIEDLKLVAKATLKQEILFNFIVINNSSFELKIYSPGKKISLSEILPLIENLGFNVQEEHSFHLNAADNILETWIYVFSLSSTLPLNLDNLKINVEEVLTKTITNEITNCSLNKLATSANLSWQQIKVLRALTRYLHQTGFAYGKGYVQLTLLKHFKASALIIDLFEDRFNINLNSLPNQIETARQAILNYLTAVVNSIEDKVLRSIYEIVEAITRTNLYQKTDDGKNKNYLSFKFNSKLISFLPQPIPFAEIYVYANDFEGLHLRGGKVARGGLRWSDRHEDYRVEVLGLMKAQMTKNAVIVPVGSKGGFCLNFTADKYSANEFQEKVVECYKNFLRGLLDLTDNIIDHQIITPKNLIIYDQLDPYLVVAADKGTATFSDYANSIAKEYNFWLNDAFASGGSAGYDHKKMGITAKGAWISAYPHFERLKINIDQDPFTVIGIGDMSGDVFGNGMLRTKYIKLIAAFNHMHIFIDPNPNYEESFLERKRLFEMKGSKWSDYDPALISSGGGVFERTAKTITLSKEIKLLLDIEQDEVTPEYLIKAILMAKADLLWNGGIGTYIKASTENNAEIGDKSNDALRCDGNQIRARVIIEGGNLGVSQLGRIEYSKNGGLINTDFIDNSAGVDCSDHEVNVKIVLNQAINSQKLTVEDRDIILSKMTDQIEKLVVEDNYKQGQAITIMEHSADNLETFSRLMHNLENNGLLHRKVEFLPSSSELTRRAKNNETLARPELCVLLSYSKMWIYQSLVNGELVKDKYFDKFLLDYFPSMMQESFHAEILSHPLKNEIIATMLTNRMVNQLCGVTMDTIQRETGAEFEIIAKAYVVICQVLNLDWLWKEIEQEQPKLGYKIYFEIFLEIAKTMRRGIAWIIKNFDTSLKIELIINQLQGEINILLPDLSKHLTGNALTSYTNKLESLTQLNLNTPIVNAVASLGSLISLLDIINLAKITDSNPEDITPIYFNIAEIFSLDWLRQACDLQLDSTYWNGLATQAIKDDLYNKQNKLLIKILKSQPGQDKFDKNLLNEYLIKAKSYNDYIIDLKNQGKIDMNMLVIANKKFALFLNDL